MPSEWTLSTLKEHLDERIDAQDRAVTTAMAAAEKAVTKAEIATEKRLEGLNELRGAMSDQQSTFVRQDVANARFKSLEVQMAALTSRDTERTGRSTGLNAAWGYGAGAIGLVLAIASFVTR